MILQAVICARCVPSCSQREDDRAGTDPVLYWYLVLNEDIKSSLPDLGWRPDVLWKRYRGWSFQQYIDNFYAQR